MSAISSGCCTSVLVIGVKGVQLRKGMVPLLLLLLVHKYCRDGLRCEILTSKHDSKCEITLLISDSVHSETATRNIKRRWCEETGLARFTGPK